MPAIANQVKLGWGNPDSVGFEKANIVSMPLKKEKIRVNKEMTVIFSNFISDLVALGVVIEGKILDDWGYANRNIRGATSKSYHSWGLAIDLNATSNPMGVNKTSFPVDATRALCRKYKLRWGYDYSGRKDAMHFEFLGSVADARALTAKILAGKL